MATTKTINLTDYYYKKEQINDFLAEKADDDHIHGNITNVGKVSTTLSNITDVGNIIVTDNRSGNSYKNNIIATSTIPTSKVKHEDKTLNNILSDLYALIDEQRTNQNQIMLSHPFINGEHSTFYFTKLGNLVIFEYGIISTQNIPSPSNYEYNNEYQYFKVGEVPEGFKPKKSNKYFDTPSQTTGSVIRICIKPDGDILLRATFNKAINVFGAGVYLIDTKNYIPFNT